jgi:hypothetical protein
MFGDDETVPEDTTEEETKVTPEPGVAADETAGENEEADA